MAEYRVCFLCGRSFIAPPDYDLPVDVCPDCRAKERDRVHRHRQRARDCNAPDTLTLHDWLRTLADFNGRCAYCETRPFVELEHFIPIADGGGTTADNCIPACERCNRGKGTDNPGLQMALPGLEDAGRERVRAYLAKRQG